MRSGHDRRTAAALAVAAALVAAVACSRPLPRGEPGADPSPDPQEAEPAVRQAPVPLLVRNRGLVEVTVELVHAGGARGRRIATVSGYSSARLMLERRDLQPGSILAVRVQAVGSRNVWRSPAVAVGQDMMAYLDVYSERSGNLGRSTLWTGAAAARADSSGAGAPHAAR